jgi:3-hydroxyisobutyrate dehydrogenase-like beta-hydroxyacid dehydrogenase
MNLNKNAKNYKMTYVDAPVSGGFVGAVAGTLAIMVGAENE